MINFNFHQHSNFSDGAFPPEDYVTKAVELHFLAIGFTEHSPLPFDNSFSLKEENVTNYVSTIESLKTKYNGAIAVYRALEMDYIPRISTDFDYWKNKCNADYLIGSVHLVAPPNTEELWFTDGPKYETYDKGLTDYFDGNIKLAVRTYFHQVNEMIETQSFDVLGHFDKIKMHNQDRYFTEDEAWYQHLVDECLDLAKQKNLIIEINTRGIYKKRSKSLFPDNLALEKVKKLNLPITISSDAHQPIELNLGFKKTEIKLAAMGFKDVMFFNNGNWITKPLS